MGIIIGMSWPGRKSLSPSLHILARRPMSPFLSRRLVFGLVLLAASAASAQSTREALSESVANQFGLHRAWYTRAQASQGIGRIESLVLDQDTLLVQTRA